MTVQSAQVMLPLLSSGVMAAATSLSRDPAVAAMALCCMSMLEVSLIGCSLLVVGLWSLLGPHRCETFWWLR